MSELTAKEAPVKCVYPSCNEMIKPSESKPILCEKHKGMYEFFKWCVPHVKFVQKVEPQKLVVPGLVSGMRKLNVQG